MKKTITAEELTVALNKVIYDMVFTPNDWDVFAEICKTCFDGCDEGDKDRDFYDERLKRFFGVNFRVPDENFVNGISPMIPIYEMYSVIKITIALAFEEEN